MKKISLWAAVLCAGTLGTAHAHSQLRSSTPAEGSTVAAPVRAVLGFSETTHLAAVTLTRGSDSAIKVESLPQQSAQQLTVPLPKLIAGAWTLAWRAIGDDGHVTHGAVHFTVAVAH
jgi:methionine-rich copper-binding protein CopC